MKKVELVQCFENILLLIMYLTYFKLQKVYFYVIDYIIFIHSPTYDPE